MRNKFIYCCNAELWSPGADEFLEGCFELLIGCCKLSFVGSYRDACKGDKRSAKGMSSKLGEVEVVKFVQFLQRHSENNWFFSVEQLLI